MSRDLPPDSPVPPLTPASPGRRSFPSAASIRAVAAGEATRAEVEEVHRFAATDSAVAARLEAERCVEDALRAESLLPLPLGLVNRILEHVEGARDVELATDTGLPPDRIADGARVRARGSRSRREWVAIAAGAVLALGAGIGGLWTVVGSGDLRTLVGATADSEAADDASPVASLASLAGEARTSTHSAVVSLAAVPDRLPGSPAALGLGAVALLGAAVVGVRRSGRTAAGPASADARRSHGSRS